MHFELQNAQIATDLNLLRDFFKCPEEFLVGSDTL